MRLCLTAITGDPQTQLGIFFLSAAGGWRTSFLLLIVPNMFCHVLPQTCIECQCLWRSLKISGVSKDGHKAISAHESRAFNIIWLSVDDVNVYNRVYNAYEKDSETQGTLNTAAFGISTCTTILAARGSYSMLQLQISSCLVSGSVLEIASGSNKKNRMLLFHSASRRLKMT